jgi:uncharacterized protein (TIGR02145 family)
MKTIKYFTMAALALLMTTACSNDDNDMSSAEPQQAQGITITAQLAPKEGGVTRAVIDDTDGTLVATWVEGEDIAILYNGKQTIALVTEVDGDGSATIEFEVASGTVDGTACTLVYPASAADINNGVVKSYEELFATQTGLLTADLDVRVGSGTIQTTTPGLTVTTQPQPQFSIFKLFPTDVSGTDYLYPVTLSISDDQGNVITTATQPNPEKLWHMFYVALPPLATGVYWFNATKNSGMPYIARVTVGTETEPGKFYNSTVKMATIGDVVLSNGKFAAKGTANERAVIAYIGTVDNYFNHFLAIAPEDANSAGLNWESAMEAVGTYAAAHPITIGGTPYGSNETAPFHYDKVDGEKTTTSATAVTLVPGWRLPSVTDWRYILDGLGRIGGGYTLTDGTNAVTPTSPLGVSYPMVYGGDPTLLQEAIGMNLNNTYWSSSKYNSTNSWYYDFNYGKFSVSDESENLTVRAVFAY